MLVHLCLRWRVLLLLMLVMIMPLSPLPLRVNRSLEGIGKTPVMATAAGHESAQSGGAAAGGPTLGFVGAGMMSTAMINGIIAAKVNKSATTTPTPPPRTTQYPDSLTRGCSPFRSQGQETLSSAPRTSRAWRGLPRPVFGPQKATRRCVRRSRIGVYRGSSRLIHTKEHTSLLDVQTRTPARRP